MGSDLSHIQDFIAELPPFSELTNETLGLLIKSLEIEYFRANDRLKRTDGLVIIRAGAAELKGADQQLIDRCHEGTSFYLAGLNAEHPGITATFIEDTLAYILPDKDYQRIKQDNRDFARFFHSQRSRRIRRASRYEPKAHEMMRPVSDIMARQLVSVQSHRAMRPGDERLSRILVADYRKRRTARHCHRSRPTLASIG
jgi:CBS domain-containing protein